MENSQIDVEVRRFSWETNETYFVGKKHKVTKRINRFLAQAEINWTITISLIELVYIQLLDLCCKINNREPNWVNHKINSKTKEIERDQLLGLVSSDEDVWLL